MPHEDANTRLETFINDLVQSGGLVKPVQLRVSMVSEEFKSGHIVVPSVATFLDVDLKLSSSTTWSTAVMDLEWAMAIGTDDTDRNIEQWNTFTIAKQMSTTVTYLRSVPVFGLGYVRLTCSTAASDSDPDATALLRFA